MDPKIIFEDESIIILDKPSGWIVNEATTTGRIPVIQKWLKNNFDYPLTNNREYRNGIVHRLDKETSGALMVAKTRESFENLQKQFKERKVQKKYTALVHWSIKSPEGEIKAPLGRLPWRRERFGVLPGGKDAVTIYKTLEHFKLKSDQHSFFTLAEFYPKTGRTHQIRIHAKYIGHPICSDEFYAGRKTSRRDKKWCPRLFLHASELSFIHPTEKNKLKFTSKLPKDLIQVLDSLEKIASTT